MRDPNWLENILADALERAAKRPAWARSDWAQKELDKIQAKSKTK